MAVMRVGIPNGEIEAAMRMLAIPRKDRPEVFAGVLLMQDEAMAVWAKVQLKSKSA